MTPSREDADELMWFEKTDTFIVDRVNDIHLTNAEKQAARERAEAKA